MSNRPSNPDPGPQEVSVVCTCGKTHCFNIRHYDRVLLSCVRPMWALQPKRNGPLVMFPWPGPALTARELAAKEAAEQEDGWAAARLSL